MIDSDFETPFKFSLNLKALLLTQLIQDFVFLSSFSEKHDSAANKSNEMTLIS